jgi:hypothetical protein
MKTVLVPLLETLIDILRRMASLHLEMPAMRQQLAMIADGTARDFGCAGPGSLPLRHGSTSCLSAGGLIDRLPYIQAKPVILLACWAGTVPKVEIESWIEFLVGTGDRQSEEFEKFRQRVENRCLIRYVLPVFGVSVQSPFT